MFSATMRIMAEKSLLCMFFIIPAVAPQMYRCSKGMA